MDALLLTPENQKDFDLLQAIALKMKIKFAVLNEEEREDYALGRAMLSVMGTEKESEESILEKLKR